MSSIPDIVTIGQMIDSAFGEPEKNVVHHKLIQAVLIILARQLRILDRRVKLELFNNLDFYSSGSSLSVTEVRIQAVKKKRRPAKSSSVPARGKGIKGPGPVQGPPSGPGQGSDGKSPKEGITRATEETIQDYAKGNLSITAVKTRSLRSDPKHGTIYTSRAAMLADPESSTQERSTGGKITFGDEDHSSSTDKYSTSTSDQVTTEKTSTEKSSTDKTTTESTTDKTTTESTTDKTTTESTTDKTTTESTTYKTTTESTTDKTTTESTTDKTTTESPTDKTTTTTTTELSSDKTTEKSSTQKSATDTSKSSSGKTPATSLDKTKTDTSAGKAASDRKSTMTSATKSTKSTPAKTTSSSDKRADSREERDKSPTPMASMDSVEVQYEKLLVVERVPSEEAKARIGRLQGETRGSVPTLSIVTQEEFLKLANVVQKIQAKFDPVGAAAFPENLQLMQELRKGASLTDAMAALQLSARLEAAENALGRMTSLVTDLASKYSGIDLTQLTEPTEPDTEVLYGAPGLSSQTPPRLSKTAAFKQPPKPKSSQSEKVISEETAGESVSAPTTSVPTTPAPSDKGNETAAAPPIEEDNLNLITMDDLENALQEIYDNVMSSLSVIVNKSKANSEAALKVANRVEGKLDASLDLGNRMTDLETLVADYAEKVNELDTGLSSQMTNYQEIITQMQHDLESGLENMAEALATSGGDATAVAELNSHFTNLQLDFETTNSRQNELSEIQKDLKSELQELRTQIEILRGIKSDRDEVADALRDKVGLGTLNGLTSLEQFDAVRGDLEQRIGAAYDKFNNQELVWQKAIDDIFRELGEKADWTQVVFLREDIKRNIEKVKNRIQAMLDIVGEPQAAAVSKRVYRETNCLSCSTPAHLGTEEDTIPTLPAMPGTRPPTLGAESPQKKEHDGVCYPTLPIPHLREPRAHICNRYCGGSHTKMPATLPRAPDGMLISPAVKQGSGDADKKVIRKPCIPCNVKPKVTKDLPKPEHEERKIPQGVKEDEESIGSVPEDFVRMSSLKSESIVETPPVPQEDD